MRNLKGVVAAVCASILLANCSYFDHGESVAVVDVTSPKPSPIYESEVDGKDVIYFSTPYESYSNGSVEVYGFGRDERWRVAPGTEPDFVAVPQQGEERAVRSPTIDDMYVSASGHPVYSDDSVEVFSFGEGFVTPRAEEQDAAIVREESALDRIVNSYTRETTSSAPTSMSTDKAAKLYFGHGAKAVNKDGQVVLGRLSEDLADKNHPIKVTGYASERADIANPIDRKIANLKTSMDRAFSVTSQLIRSGVPAETIETSAWGEAHPAVAMGDMDAEQASRRVEVTSRSAR